MLKKWAWSGLTRGGGASSVRGMWRGITSGAATPLISRECAGQTVTFHETLPHWIGGRKVFAEKGARTLEKRYPATGEVLCRVPVAGEATIDDGTPPPSAAGVLQHCRSSRSLRRAGC